MEGFYKCYNHPTVTKMKFDLINDLVEMMNVHDFTYEDFAGYFNMTVEDVAKVFSLPYEQLNIEQLLSWFGELNYYIYPEIGPKAL